MKLSDLKTNNELLAEDLRDPEFRAEWERTALARAIAIEVVKYRAEHELSQRQLASVLGMKQPQVARLESGDVTPSIETLIRLSHRLDIEIALDFRPAAAAAPKLLNKRAQTRDMVASYNSAETTVLVAAA